MTYNDVVSSLSLSVCPSVCLPPPPPLSLSICALCRDSGEESVRRREAVSTLDWDRPSASAWSDRDYPGDFPDSPMRCVIKLTCCLSQTKGQRETERERKRKGKEEEGKGRGRERRKGKENWKRSFGRNGKNCKRLSGNFSPSSSFPSSSPSDLSFALKKTHSGAIYPLPVMRPSYRNCYQPINLHKTHV